MQKPLVSVIVPIYNAQNNIVRCVESIRRQTYENLEILLLNDGSKDVSYPVCEMLSKADARIVLIDKENSGVSATRNLGMRMARGKYLQFVDADDTLEPFATELLVQRAEDNNADLVIAAYNRIVPAMLTLGVFTLMNTWNDYMGPLIYLSSPEKYTMTLGIAYFKGVYTTQWNLVMAGSIVSVVPILIAYLCAQKYFIEGIAFSGVKG